MGGWTTSPGAEQDGRYETQNSGIAQVGSIFQLMARVKLK